MVQAGEEEDACRDGQGVEIVMVGGLRVSMSYLLSGRANVCITSHLSVAARDLMPASLAA
jgi:hypothetical protein